MVAIGGGVQFLDVGRSAGTLQNAYVGETHITDSFPGRMDWDTNTPRPTGSTAGSSGSTPPRRWTCASG